MRMAWRHAFGAQVPMLLAMAALLLAMGRSPICSCGFVTIWSGSIWSPENSQQFVDAYSFVHVLHGVLFFWLFRVTFRGASIPSLLVVVTACAIGWELIENSSFLIERYREATISASYAGDSVLNSVCDVGFCVIGFLFAARLPWHASVLGVVATEVTLALTVHDGLLLNIVMLLHPIEAVRRWQLGG